MAESETKGAPAAEKPSVRVVCRHQTASSQISGVKFAPITIGDDSFSVSERITKAQAERFCSIDGYEPWTGDEKEHGRKIEDALSAVQKAAVKASQAPSDRNKAQLDEMRTANRAMADENRSLRERVEQLAAENEKLKAETAQLKADGARLKKPAPAPQETA